MISKNWFIFLVGILFVAPVHAQVSLPKLKKDHVYTVLLVPPPREGLSPKQLQAIDLMKKEAQNVYPVLVEEFVSALTTANGVKEVFVNTSNALQEKLKASFTKINNNLAEDPIYVALYVVPWEIESTARRAENPLLKFVQFLEVDWSAYKTRADFYARLTRNIDDLVRESDGLSYQFMGASLQLRLERNNSGVQAQVLGAIPPKNMPFVKTNDQVHVERLEVLSDKENHYKPIALLTMTQMIKKEATLPEIVVDLGPFGGISGGLGGWHGQFQTFRDPINNEDCVTKLQSVPSLVGVLGPKPAGQGFLGKLLGRIVQGTPVRFRILDMKIDAETLKVTTINVVTELGSHRFPQCLGMASINEDFKTEANDAIQSQVESLYKQDDMTDDLMSALYQ